MGALTGRERQQLARAGFLPFEIKAFNNARTPDGKHYQNLNTSSENWRKMLGHRQEWAQGLLNRGWTKDQVINEILQYYGDTRSKRTPFDFLQIESSPRSRTRKITDSELARKYAKKTRIAHQFGRRYGPRMGPLKIPRDLPRAPKFPNL